MRVLREASMSPAIAEWLNSLGLEVYSEVPFYCSAIDHVGVCWATGRVVCVEMKVNLSHKVVHQAYLSQLNTPHSYAAVIAKPSPKSMERAAKRGIGVIRVIEGKTTVLLEPRESTKTFGAERLLERLKHMPKGGVGGKPCLKGVGPAQDVERDIAEYRAANPRATWADVFRDVPNHYANARSMQGAMRSNQKRRAWRERMAARKAGAIA